MHERRCCRWKMELSITLTPAGTSIPNAGVLRFSIENTVARNHRVENKEADDIVCAQDKVEASLFDNETLASNCAQW